MNNIVVEQVFLQVVADKLWRDINDVTACKNVTKMGFFDALGVGVLGIVSVVMALERKFDINITGEEIYSLAKMSYSEIVELLERAVREKTKPAVDKTDFVGDCFMNLVREKTKPAVDKTYAQEEVKSEKQNKPVVVLRTMKDGKPYCELTGKKCSHPERVNTTGKDYCEFMNCVIYKNFQRLR